MEPDSINRAIRMLPTEGGEGWYYLAEGTWDLPGTDPLSPRRAYPDGCGGGFEPPTFESPGSMAHSCFAELTGFDSFFRDGLS